MYDCERFIGKVDLAAIPLVQMAKQASIESYAPEKIKRPWTEEHPYFLLVASMIKTVKGRRNAVRSYVLVNRGTSPRVPPYGQS